MPPTATETETEFEPTTEPIEQQEQHILGEVEREHYEEIRELERLACESEADYEDAKATAASKKKIWEKDVIALRACIRRGPDAQGKLPFRDDWRTVPIEEAITLTDKQLEKLHECGVKTVEDFETLRAGQMKDYPGGLLDVKGFGQAFVDAAENDILDWLAANQEPEDEPEEDGETETEADEGSEGGE